MSNAESMTKYECCSVRCRQRSRRNSVIRCGQRTAWFAIRLTSCWKTCAVAI